MSMNFNLLKMRYVSIVGS